MDQLGNWPEFKERDDDGSWDLDQDRTHNAANELTQIDSSTTHVAEDLAGNMTKIPQPTSWSAHFDLTYDAWNRLVEVKVGETVVQTNQYDGFGQRIVRVDAVANPDVTHYYYYNDSWQLLEERKDFAGDPLNQYVWHPYYIDALAIRWYDADTDGILAENDDGAYYAIQDANFNVTAITDDGGAVKERYQYSPYGEVTFLEDDFDVKGSQITNYGNQHLYTGRERDPETGLQLNRNRFYAAHLGRWVNRDPIGYKENSLNLFQYVLSNPLVLIDPSGTHYAVISVSGEIGRKWKIYGVNSLSETLFGYNGLFMRLSGKAVKKGESYTFVEGPTLETVEMSRWLWSGSFTYTDVDTTNEIRGNPDCPVECASVVGTGVWAARKGFGPLGFKYTLTLVLKLKVCADGAVEKDYKINVDTTFGWADDDFYTEEFPDADIPPAPSPPAPAIPPKPKPPIKWPGGPGWPGPPTGH